MSGKAASTGIDPAMPDKRQQIQDDDYAFPYHYVPRFRQGYSHTYSWAWGLYYVSAMEFVLERVQALKPKSIADIGTGDGRLVREMALTMPEAVVTGIDYSARAIQLATALNPKLDFRCLDIMDDAVSQTFDVLTLVEVFEHIPPELTSRFVAALRTLISDHGALIVTVPHSNLKVTRKHFQHFTSESLKSHFSSHFMLEESVFLDRQSRAVRWIRSLLENRYFILVHWGLRNRLYKSYKRHFLIADEKHCGRIYMRFRPIPLPA